MTEPTMSAATSHSSTDNIVSALSAAIIGRIRSPTAPARSMMR